MKKVMVFGTFDIFHKGHINFLKQAKKYGDFLIVVVAQDQTVKKVKGKLPLNNKEKRVEEIRRSNLANEVFEGELGDKYEVIRKTRPEIICLGYDQKFFIDELRAELDKNNLQQTKIVRLKAYKPEIYKSSKLRHII